MLLSTNMLSIYNVFGMKGTFDILSQAGFQGIDFNNDVMEYYTDAHNEQYYRELGEYAAQRNIAICQAHAPFPSSYVAADKTEKRFEEIVSAMRNAAYLGAPMIVVHPCTHLDYSVDGNPEILFDFNVDFYRRLIPYARHFGIKIAIENIGITSVTSTPERLNRLYDTLNDDVFTVCLDVGHCLLESVDPAEAIKTIGDRLVNGCTHIHDNCGDKDAHTIPYCGKVEWERVMQALADIGYKGELSYEAESFFKGVPVELRPDGLAYMAKIGRYLIGRFEHYVNNK